MGTRHTTIVRKFDEDNLRNLGMTLLRFIGSALIVKPVTNTPLDVTAMGTFSYINTGEQALLVTCDHVHKEFVAQRKIDSNIEFCWGIGEGQEPLQLTHCSPLDRNSHFDICTFACKYSNSDLEKIGKSFFESKSWPPPRVKKGDLVIGIGFQGKHKGIKTNNGQRGLSLVASFVSGQVSTVSDRHFTLADEDCSRWVIKLGETNYSASWGGLSGGPFFQVIKPDHYELAGFMKEGGSNFVSDTGGTVARGEKKSNEINATLFIAHADIILATGKLDHGLMPY